MLSRTYMPMPLVLQRLSLLAESDGKLAGTPCQAKATMTVFLGAGQGQMMAYTERRQYERNFAVSRLLFPPPLPVEPQIVGTSSAADPAPHGHNGLLL
jgi:hypothetical protein